MLGATNAILVSAALAAAALLTFGRDADLFFTYYAGTLRIGVATALFLVSTFYVGVLEVESFASYRVVWTRLIQSLGLWVLMLATLNYAWPQILPGLRVLMVGICLAALLLFLWHRIFFAAVHGERLTERTLVLGDGLWASNLAYELGKRRDVGISLVGYVDTLGPSSRNGLRYLGTPDQLTEVVSRESVDHIVVAMSERRGRLPVDELLSLKKKGVQVLEGTDLYENAMGRVPVQWLKTSWLLFSPGFSIPRSVLTHKRAAAILGSALGLVLTGPLMALAALAIKLDSPGPVLLRQDRVGLEGKTFKLFKFRTMYHGAEKDRSFSPTQAGDPRVTRLGRWLRVTHIDELPQLYNILRGDMCFVGPRPFVPWQEELLVNQIPFYSQRWAIKPGATGWAQVSRGYCATLQDNVEKLEYDLFYIKNLSFALDLLILFKTTKILLLGRGAQ